MPKFARVICTLEHDSGLPEDHYVNVMHFDGDDSQTWAEDADDLVARIDTFYTAIVGNLGSTLSGARTYQVYDLSEPTPRVPKYEERRTTGWSMAGTCLPEEVALCVSFQASQESGLSQARRRGRIYLGPWASTSNVVTSGRARPADAVITAVATAFGAMAIGPDAGDFRLSVFSPTTFAATNSLDQAFNDVVDGWVDNAWDTQRRRGAPTLARTTFVAS